METESRSPPIFNGLLQHYLPEAEMPHKYRQARRLKAETVKAAGQRKKLAFIRECHL